MCCRGRGVSAGGSALWPPLGAASVQAVPASQGRPCYAVDTQGDFLGLRIVQGVLQVVAGNDTHEAKGYLAACTSPSARSILQLVEQAYAINKIPSLVSLVGDRAFTVHFLRSQMAT